MRSVRKLTWRCPALSSGWTGDLGSYEYARLLSIRSREGGSPCNPGGSVGSAGRYGFRGSAERHVAILPFRENVQNFPIVRTGSLTGKVTYLDYSEDPDNPAQKPLPEARVFADGKHDTFSDLSGNITIGSLKPGTYQLKVDPETVPEGYLASAESIQVRAGEVLRGVQVQLKIPPRPVVTIDLPRQQSVTTPQSGIEQ